MHLWIHSGDSQGWENTLPIRKPGNAKVLFQDPLHWAFLLELFGLFATFRTTRKRWCFPQRRPLRSLWQEFCLPLFHPPSPERICRNYCMPQQQTANGIIKLALKLLLKKHQVVIWGNCRLRFINQVCCFLTLNVIRLFCEGFRFCNWFFLGWVCKWKLKQDSGVKFKYLQETFRHQKQIGKQRFYQPNLLPRVWWNLVLFSW